MEVTDLENCKFYIFLQRNLKNLYDMAQEKQYCICIPCNESVVGAVFDLNFVEYHILKPSPFFKEHFETIHLKENICNLRIENGFICKEDDSSRVQILREEQCYNKNYLPFRVLILEKPLVEATIDKTLEATERLTLQPVTEVITFASSIEYIKSYSECNKVLVALNRTLDVFNSSYMVIPGYLSETAARLKEIYIEYAKRFLQTTTSELRHDERHVQNTERAVENVILHATHSKVFAAVCKECSTADGHLGSQVRALSHVTSQELGVPASLVCDMQNALTLMRQLSELETSLDLLNCMKQILDCIHITLQEQDRKERAKNDEHVINTDVVLPTLVHVIIQSKPTNLLSTLHYVQLFHWSSSPANDLSYALVTFQAASQHIQHMQAKAPDSPNNLKQDIDRQTSFGAWCETSLQMNDEYAPQQKDGLSSNTQEYHVDKQLDRINHLIHNTSISTSVSDEVSATGLRRPANPLSAQRARGAQRSPQLGSFLEALRSDTLHSRYGKQS